MADKRRTKMEIRANEFDRKLHGLIYEAADFLDAHQHGQKWLVAWRHLCAARRNVQDLMHPMDRKDTE